MDSVYILMHERKPNVLQLAQRISEAFRGAGIRVAAETWLYELCASKGLALFDGSSPSGAEAIVSVGGDGTLLRGNALALEMKLPVFGINVGRVGFLTEVEMEELEKACAMLKADAFTIESRMMLEIDVEGERRLALNDVVLSRGGYARLIGIDAWVEQEHAGHFMADGLIVSTPTGSTGYSLSAGGPIVCPDLECMLMTPICAHSLQHRPVVTSGEKPITIRLDGEQVDAMVSIDGQKPFPFCSGHALTVRRAEQCARFIRLKPKSFFSKIRIKLSEWSC